MLNKVIFQGRFVRSAEFSDTKNPVYAKFTLAWSEKFGGTDQKCFINCVAFNKTAEFITKYFDKGDMILVEGKLITSSYKDKSGNNKSSTELIVDKAHFCGRNGEIKEKLEDDESVLAFDI